MPILSTSSAQHHLLSTTRLQDYEYSNRARSPVSSSAHFVQVLLLAFESPIPCAASLNTPLAMLVSRCVLLAVCVASVLAFSSALLHPRSSQASYTIPVSEHRHSAARSSPVYLNECASPSDAQDATRVHLPAPFADRESYAGYATVNKSCGSNLFYCKQQPRALKALCRPLT